MAQDAAGGVAVIGMGCRFPGGAEGLDRFWDLLANSGDAITGMPAGRWAAGLRYHDGSSLVPGKTRDMSGGFLDDIAGWDARLFGVPPQEARRIDPQQRLVMEAAWRAIEDAGIGLADFRAARTGIFAGVTDSQQFTRLEHQYDPPCVDDPYMAVGSSVSMAAGRLAFFLNAGGPALSVDTACSTSLVALHLAMESLLRGECDLAIVATGSAVIHPESFVAAYQIGMLARDGRCRAFDRHADGFSIGEGAGAVLLERAADAAANRHRIRAVALGSAVNQNGRSDAITAPQRQAQADVIRRALARSGVAAGQVCFVEAHGAGTVLGDAIELEALAEVFGPRAAGQPLHVGAVKTNVGHLLVAAGMAGLIKTVLALERRCIPPNINFQTPNPILRRTPWLQPVASAVELDPGQRPIAGVSSFGWSGTNAHVVVQAAVRQPAGHQAAPAGRPHVLTLAAGSAGALAALAGELADQLEQQRPELADVARTLQAGRSWHPVRRAIVCSSTEQAALACRSVPGQPQRPAGRAAGARVGLSFPGGAGRAAAAQLRDASGSFRAAADACREAFLAAGLDPLAGQAAADHALASAGDPPVPSPAAADALEFTTGYAIAAVLAEAGLRPAGLYGAGPAEYLAGCLAGVFSLEHAARMVVARAGLARHAGMAGQAVQPTAAGQSDAAWQPAAAGQAAALDQLRQAAASAPLGRPSVPLVSAESGAWIAAGSVPDPDYWARPPGRAVPAAQAIQTLAANVDLIAEAGQGGLPLNGTAFRPAGGSLPAGGSVPAGGQPAVPVVPLLASGAVADRDDPTALLQGIARLWEEGAQVAWTRVVAPAGQIVSLPPHPFERRQFWPSVPAAGADQDLTPGGAVTVPGDRPLYCYTRRWHQPAGPARAAASRPGTAVLFPAAGKLTGLAGLAGQLRAAGWRVQLAPAGLSAPDRAALLTRAAADTAEGARLQVIDWSGLGDTDRPFQPGQAVTAFSGLMLTCQAISQSLAGRDLALIAAVSGTVEVVGGEADSVPGGACAGLMSALSAEYPWLRGRLVDLDPATVAASTGAASTGAASTGAASTGAASTGAADSLASQIIGEIGWLADEEADPAAGQGAAAGWPADRSLVAWRNGRRWVSCWAPAEVPATPSPWRADGVYVITGGTRGLGMALARHIARASRPRLVLAGRTEIPPRSRWDAVLDGSAPAADRVRGTIADVRQLEQDGAQVVVLSADVAEPAQMSSVLRAARERFGTVHGIVHCAGVPGGGLLDRKTTAEAAAVISAKTGALAPLSEEIQAGQLDFAVLYSSAVTALGGLGETDYAAANACLESFASAHSGSGTRVLAVSWGPWQHDDWQPAGLAGAPDLASAARRYRAEFGITEAAGVALLARLIGITSPNVLVLTEPLAAARQRWAGLRDLDVMAVAAAADDRQPRPGLLVPYVPPGTPLQRSLAEIWQQYLGLEQVGIDDPFFDLGGNSLIGVSMVRRLERDLGLALPPSLLFARPTVRELAAALDQGQPPGHREPAPPDQRGLRRQLRANAVQARRRELQTRKEART